MGFDLKLIVQDDPSNNTCERSYTFKREDQINEVFNSLSIRSFIPISEDGLNVLHAKNDVKKSYCNITHTLYGDLLKGIQAHRAKETLKNIVTYNEHNKRIINEINKLPNDAILWLYWF